MAHSYSSSDAHSSDIQTAVSRLQLKKDIVGYRNLLSYTTSLGVPVLSRAKVHRHPWKQKGEGKYSIAYETILDGKHPEKVIVKQPKASFTRDDNRIETRLQHQALSSIIQELRILTHQELRNHGNLPHILGIFFEEEVNPAGTRPCVIFERAVSDLGLYLKENSMSLPSKVMISLSSDIAAGISAIHAHGLVHGDLKPENVLLFLRRGRLTGTVADFGTCGTADQPPRDVGIIPGTVGFWAPEYYQNSIYHSWVNRPPRDIYGFGLVVFSIMTYDNAPPFLSNSVALQHNDEKCLDLLRQRIPRASKADLLWNVVEYCVLANPEKRSSLAQISAKFRNAHSIDGADKEYCKIQDLAQQKLLTDPDNPRVNALHSLGPSDHLHSRLVSEYIMASEDKVDIRLAVTMAALYSGAIGHALNTPSNFIAKAQWLMKAIELGSLPAVHAVFEDRNTLLLVETIGRPLLFYAPASFRSPSISLAALLDRLTEFASRPDIESLNLLVFLGGQIPEHLHLGNTLSPSATLVQEKIRQYFPDIQEESYWERYLGEDLQILDSDAYDMVLSRKGDVFSYAYSDDLEGLIHELKSAPEFNLQHLLAFAIFGGSIKAVLYLLENYHIDPNGIVGDGMTEETDMEIDDLEGEPPETSHDDFEGDSESLHADTSLSSSIPDFQFFEKVGHNYSFLDNGIILGRRAIVQALVEHGATIRAASEDSPSSLHYLARFDDAELARILCKSVADKGICQQIMESKPSRGHLRGMSAIELNMLTGRWMNVLEMIQHAVKPNSNEGEDNLLHLAVSRTRPAPLFIVRSLLEQDFDPNIGRLLAQPPLYCAIGTSNVVATEILLRNGASPSPPGADNLMNFAKERLDEISLYKRVEVFNEHGITCTGGLERVKEAAETVYAMTLIASKADENWLEELANCISQCDDDCKGKVWRADKTDPLQTTMLLEIQFPLN